MKNLSPRGVRELKTHCLRNLNNENVGIKRGNLQDKHFSEIIVMVICCSENCVILIGVSVNLFIYMLMHIKTEIVSDMMMVAPNNSKYLQESMNQVVKYRPYVCMNCGKSYTSLGNLNRHSNFECGKERKFFCIMCESKFFRKYHLERHLMLRHEVNIKEIYNHQLIKEC